MSKPRYGYAVAIPTHLPLSYTLSAHTDIARSDIMKLKLSHVCHWLLTDNENIRKRFFSFGVLFLL